MDGKGARRDPPILVVVELKDWRVSNLIDDLAVTRGDAGVGMYGDKGDVGRGSRRPALPEPLWAEAEWAISENGTGRD